MQARPLAYQALLEIESGAYANLVLDEYLRKGQLSGPDRGLATEIVYGTVKYRQLLDWLIDKLVAKPEKLQTGPRLILRMAFYQLLFLDRVPASAATNEAVKVMDALGKDIVIIETVGVGQSEFDIMHIANTTLVVLTPGAGDAIQTIKAGIMEIADIFVVNKSDLEGSDRVKMEVEAMLDMKKTNGWRPPVVQTASISGNGFQELWHKILDHKNYLESSGHLVNQRKKRLEEEAREILEHEVKKHVWQAVEASGEWEQIVESLYNKEMDPYTAAKKLIAAHFNIL